MKRIQRTDAAQATQSGTGKRVRITKRRRVRREPQPLDLRTPSGRRRLPY